MNRYFMKVMLPSFLVIIIMNVGMYFMMEYLVSAYDMSAPVAGLVGMLVSGAVVIGVMITRPSQYLFDRWFDFVENWGKK